MEQEQDFFEANRALWNQRTAAHLASDFYAVDRFRAGASTLNRIETEALGDVRGKSLLHLQCHFGLDTLSWARLGAEVTGVDFSEDAISAARDLSAETGVPAAFICCNVYALVEYLDRSFDIVFTSYGTIGWLPDLDRWAGIIARFLKPGGVFFIADFHPVVWMLDASFSKIQYPYHNAAVIAETSTGSYANREQKTLPMKEYGWNHSFAEIFNALIRHGLRIERMEEFPFSPYNCFSGLEQGEDGYWRIAGMDEKIPMLYTIKAVREGEDRKG